MRTLYASVQSLEGSGNKKITMFCSKIKAQNEPK